MSAGHVQKRAGTVWNAILGGILLAGGFTWIILLYPPLWPVAVLVPALLLFGLYRKFAGNINKVASLSLLFSGMVVLTVALLFMVQGRWSELWPIFVLLTGVGLFALGGSLRESTEMHVSYIRWMQYSAVSVFLLGALFLLQATGLVRVGDYLAHWWALAIPLPCIGMIISLIVEWGQERRMTNIALFNLSGILLLGVVGVINFYQLHWKISNAMLLVTLGVIFLLGNQFYRRKA